MSMIAADLAIKQLKRKKTSVFGLATGNTPIGFFTVNSYVRIIVAK